MRSEHEREAGFQREVSMSGGASRSLEYDRDTSHRTDSHSRPDPPFVEGNEPADFELAGLGTAAVPALREQHVERIAAAAGASHSPATLRKYQAAWGRFTEWCDREGLDNLPAAPESVAAYPGRTRRKRGRRQRSASTGSRSVGRTNRPGTRRRPLTPG